MARRVALALDPGAGPLPPGVLRSGPPKPGHHGAGTGPHEGARMAQHRKAAPPGDYDGWIDTFLILAMLSGLVYLLLLILGVPSW